MLSVYLLIGMGVSSLGAEVPVEFTSLFPVTDFNRLLAESVEIWSVVQNVSHHTSDQEYGLLFERLVQLYALLNEAGSFALDKVHPGNLEYVLVIFDKMGHKVEQRFLQACIQALKQKIIELL